MISLRVHPSQYPDAIQRDWIRSLTSRTIAQKFHYDSVKQTQAWLALHAAYSPSRTDPDCIATYQRAIDDAAAHSATNSAPLLFLTVIGLGCGGGAKDSMTLRALHTRQDGNSRPACRYLATDVSAAMTLVAAERVRTEFPMGVEILPPLVWDMETTPDWGCVIDSCLPNPADPSETAEPRLFTFFGMMPNFAPHRVLPELSNLLRPNDQLLLSANLAPGPDYRQGVDQVLPGYDNDLTRRWLVIALNDLGVPTAPEDLRFSIEADPEDDSVLRITASAGTDATTALAIGEHSVTLDAGERLQLFHSYRYQPKPLIEMLRRHGLQTSSWHRTPSDEEAVFLLKKTDPRAVTF